MYIFTAILYFVLLILAIVAWNIHQTWLQAAVSVTGLGWLFPLWIHGGNNFMQSRGGWGPDENIGWGLLIIFGAIGILCLVSAQIHSIQDHNNYAHPRNHPNITLKEYNHFVALNPDVWEFPVHSENRKGEIIKTFVYRLENTRIKETFVMSYWEYMWLRITRALDVDKMSRVSNDVARAKLADAAQKDIDRLREENQKRLEKSLKRIEKMKAAQSDMMTAYGAHLETYEDEHIQEHGKNLKKTAKVTMK